jgi:hypothetical protein
MEQQAKFNIGDKVCFVGVVLDAEYEYDTVSAVILTNKEVQYDISDSGDLSCLFYESQLIPYGHKESAKKAIQDAINFGVVK